jgi:membrane protein DedA with SNARE-associated domain
MSISYEQIEFWVLANPEFSAFVMFVVAFSESFIIIGTFWPSILLLLLAITLNEADVELLTICLAAGVGSFLGDFLSFYLGSFFGPKLKQKKFLQNRKDQIKKGEVFFDRYGWGGIIIGRLTPAIRPFIPFIAGLAKMPSKTFIISSICACFIWGLALAILIIGIDNILMLFK